MVEKFCPECGCKRPIETKVISEEFIVRGEPISVSGEVNVCAECNSPLGDKVYDDLMQKAYDEYRTRHGMMSAQEIKAIRERYGLTQTLFAKILKIGEATLQRYERGSLPSPALHDLLARARNPEKFLALVEETRDCLSEDDCRTALAAISTTSGGRGFRQEFPSSFSGIVKFWIESVHDSFSPQYLDDLFKAASEIDIDKLKQSGTCYRRSEEILSSALIEAGTSVQEENQGMRYALAA